MRRTSGRRSASSARAGSRNASSPRTGMRWRSRYSASGGSNSRRADEHEPAPGMSVPRDRASHRRRSVTKERSQHHAVKVPARRTFRRVQVRVRVDPQHGELTIVPVVEVGRWAPARTPQRAADHLDAGRARPTRIAASVRAESRRDGREPEHAALGGQVSRARAHRWSETTGRRTTPPPARSRRRAPARAIRTPAIRAARSRSVPPVVTT